MEFCHVCNAEITDDSGKCSVCGVKSETTSVKWQCIGSIEDKISADYAEETLKSYDIPVVIISKSGFFGAAGLQLNPFYGQSSGLFEVLVPGDFCEEAVGILQMILGDNWQQKD